MTNWDAYLENRRRVMTRVMGNFERNGANMLRSEFTQQDIEEMNSDAVMNRAADNEQDGDNGAGHGTAAAAPGTPLASRTEVWAHSSRAPYSALRIDYPYNPTQISAAYRASVQIPGPFVSRTPVQRPVHNSPVHNSPVHNAVRPANHTPVQSQAAYGSPAQAPTITRSPALGSSALSSPPAPALSSPAYRSLTHDVTPSMTRLPALSSPIANNATRLNNPPAYRSPAQNATPMMSRSPAMRSSARSSPPAMFSSPAYRSATPNAAPALNNGQVHSAAPIFNPAPAVNAGLRPTAAPIPNAPPMPSIVPSNNTPVRRRAGIDHPSTYLPASEHPANGIFSDADPTHTVNTSRRAALPAGPDKERGWEATWRKKWREDGGDPSQEIAIPAGYRLLARPRPTGEPDKELFGHPNHRQFRGAPEAYPHIFWLITGTDGSRCRCKSCAEGKKGPGA